MKQRFKTPNAPAPAKQVAANPPAKAPAKG
jgi:hypothetical protein